MRRLYSTVVEANTVTYLVDESLRQRDFVRADLIVEYGSETDLSACPESLLAIPVLANLAPIVWLSGEAYSVPALDARFAESLERIRLELLARYPNASWDGKLVPDALEPGSPADPPGEGAPVALLFSSGVDSVYSSLAIGDEQILVAGWGNDVAYENERGWAPIAADIERFAREQGHASAWFRSNFRRVANEKSLMAAAGMFNWWGQVQHGIGLIGVTAPIMAASGARRLLISSTSPGGESVPWGSDAELVEEMAWGSVSVELYGAEVTRQEKSAFIVSKFANRNGYRPQIHVCWIDPNSNGLNCCRCQKCLRTAVAFALEDEEYQSFGFPVSREDASRRLRAGLDSLTLMVGRVDVDLWGEVQARIEELLGSPDPAERNRAEPFQWIVHVDYLAYRGDYLQRARLKRPILRVLSVAPPLERFARKLVRRGRRVRDRV